MAATNPNGKTEAQPLLDKEALATSHASRKSSMAVILAPVLYGFMNLSSVVAIVMANKVVLTTCKFSFPVTLTWLHMIFTAVGMTFMAAAGIFQKKSVPFAKTMPVSAVYVGYVVLNNLSLQLNTVGFYQILKIAITPVVVVIEIVLFGKYPSRKVVAAICLLLVGVTLATVSDKQVSTNKLGMVIGMLSTVVTAVYQVWAGSKQKELGLNGNQLLHQCAPGAALLLSFMIPLLEPVGFSDPGPGTILGFHFTNYAVGAILVSSTLGLIVTLSTFLFIGATSSLTYNVVGHLKTVFILLGGYLLFKDQMTASKLVGLAFAMTGIIWYSGIKMTEPSSQAGSSK